jgi:hypothetical protein
MNQTTKTTLMQLSIMLAVQLIAASLVLLGALILD